MSEFKFSIIIPSNNSEFGVKKTLNSLINQTLNFKEYVEAIVIDDDTSNTQNVCTEFIDKFSNNIKYFKSNSPVVNNTGIENSNGEYILFLEANDYLSEESLKNVLKFIENNTDIDLISMPTYYYKNGKMESYPNYPIEKNEVFDVEKNPKPVQLLDHSTFIKKESIKNSEFLNNNNKYPAFSGQIIIDSPKLGICKDGSYFIENIEEKTLPTEEFTFTSEEYEKFIEDNLIKLIDKSKNKYSEIPKYVQYNLLNQLNWISTIEKSEEDLNLNHLKEIAKQIDDEVILDNILLENENKIFLFLLKYDNNLDKDLRDKLNLNTVFIDIYDIINDKLHILASITDIHHHKKIEMMVNGEKINIKELSFPQYDYYSLGHKYAFNNSFEVKIPLSTDKEYEIEFKTHHEKLDIDFSRPCNFSKIVGYAKTKHYLSILENNKITIKRKKTLSWIKQELKSIVNLVKSHDSSAYKAIPFRMAYMITYPFLKNKKIWFYMDRPNESDDNGLHLFRYSTKQDDDEDKYFILDSKNEDFEDIKKIGKVIAYKSLKHRFLGMYVENIISSHPDNEIVYPFWGGYPFYAGLLKSNNIFLQHGILKDNISSWLNKKNMNLSFFLVSSKKEYYSTFSYPYNYGSEVVKLLGLPRYDNLKNVEDKHEIIIMPSWRRYLTRKSNEYILETEYFKRFNSLINNERLIEKARECNYEIIFRPHPNVYNFIELFDENEYVKIDYEKTKFQTLFNNGSLLITDYSSVAFDFAYLYKPVIYYQYGEDYHFNTEESFFDYETMGMGEICKDEEELVDLIIEYIENDCKIKDEYVERVNSFFLFNDKNNCKRVHEAIKEVPLKD